MTTVINPASGSEFQPWEGEGPFRELVDGEWDWSPDVFGALDDAQDPIIITAKNGDTYYMLTFDTIIDEDLSSLCDGTFLDNWSWWLQPGIRNDGRPVIHLVIESIAQVFARRQTLPVSSQQ